MTTESSFPTQSRLKRVLQSPLSNKRLMLRHLYWRIKSLIYYRWMFARFGKNSVIYRPMFLCNANYIEIGSGVEILDGARIEVVRDPYGRVPRLVIGNNSNIEQGAHIVCHSRVTIGENVSIAARSSIVDVTHPYDDIHGPKAARRILDEDSYVEIGDGAFIGINVVIMPNVRIGKGTVIGANSVVTRNVPDYSIAAGSPARLIRQYSHEQQAWIKVERHAS